MDFPGSATWATAVAIRVAFSALRRRRHQSSPLEELEQGSLELSGEPSWVDEPGQAVDQRALLDAAPRDPGGPVAVQVCRERFFVPAGCESRPGKGRPGRVAIPAAVEVTKRSKPGRKKAA